jgi:hypothetical protein
METITISKAEMKAIPESFSYNLFLLLDIALLSMFLFIHIFPFSHYFSSFSLFEDSEICVENGAAGTFDSFHGLINLQDFPKFCQNLNSSNHCRFMHGK